VLALRDIAEAHPDLAAAPLPIGRPIVPPRRPGRAA
jgi:hypothetical protein